MYVSPETSEPVSTSSHRTATRRSSHLRRFAALLGLLTAPFAPAALHAQGGPGPDRIDIYGGYAYFHPVNSDINNVQYEPIIKGAVGSVSFYFTKHIGVQAEGSFLPNGPNDCVFTAQGGPVFRLQRGRFVPFAHGLFGGAKVGGPIFQPCTWGIGATGGIGLDYILPVFRDHLAIRPIQADYEWSEVNYGPLVLPAAVSGGFGEIEAYRLSGGLVLRLGHMEQNQPVTLACYIQPAVSYPGDPVTLTASPGALYLKRPATFTWSTTGGTISGGATPTLNTSGLAPGTYTVTGHVTQGKRPDMQASCTAQFVIQAYQPPTLTCAANPSSVAPGGIAAITSNGLSPQNRPLTYSYNATAGQVAGNGNTATLNTAGAGPGTITINCTAVDDLGQTATAQTSVTINTPVAPAAPQQRQLCSIAFDRDRKRPARVDNEAKGCLDDIALTLNRENDATLVIVGSHDAGESPNAAAERTLNEQQYLMREKGVDGSRIALRISTAASGRSVENFLLPNGATFDNTGSTSGVDPNSVQRHGQAYGTGTRQTTAPVRRRRRRTATTATLQ